MNSRRLHDLMTLYTRRGLDDWSNSKPKLRMHAARYLGWRIAETEQEAKRTLNTTIDAAEQNFAQLRYIPMPAHPNDRGFQRAFFAPIRENKDNVIRISFELYLIVSGPQCLSFRYEPAHPLPSPHNYGHVQMNRQPLRKRAKPYQPIPTWIPSKYPAHPLGTSDPLRMFLAMTTAIHGYNDGVLKVIRDVFTAASRAREVAGYATELEAMLS